MACRHVQDKLPYLVPAASDLPPSFNFTCVIANVGQRVRQGVIQTAAWIEDDIDIIIGPGTSEMASPVAQIASAADIPVISYWAAAPGLSDKNLYPNFFRTIPTTGKSTAAAVMSTIVNMGWGRAALLHSDGAFGQAFAEGIISSAAERGVTLLSVEQFFDGNSDSIAQAVRNVAKSGARVICSIFFPGDFPAIMDVAEAEGITGQGYVWVVPENNAPGDLLQHASTNVERDWEIMSGWLSINSSPFGQGRGERFQDVWKAQSLQDVAIPGLGHELDPLMLILDCSVICGYMYDAVWTAALSLASVQDMQLDRTHLLDTLRELEFNGSTGRVLFDASLDRDAQGLAFDIVNWQPQVSAEGKLEYMQQRIGGWTKATGITREPQAMPYWYGGGSGWDAVPGDGHCRPGSAYSNAQLTCIKCPPGTAQEGMGCTPCPSGYYSPQHGATRCLACGQNGYAEGNGSSRCEPCPLHHEIPLHQYEEEGSVSHLQCVCKEGFTFGCTVPTWQVVLIVFLVILVALVAFLSWKTWRWRQAKDPEAEIIRDRVDHIRTLLHIRSQDGVLMSGEKRPLMAVLGLRKTLVLRREHVANLARLTLMHDFHVDQVDTFGAQLEFVHEMLDEGCYSPPGDLSRSSKQYHALVELLLEVSMQLLEPAGPEDQPEDTPVFRATTTTTTTSREGVENSSVRVPAQPSKIRFLFFRSHVAKLQIWDRHNNFARLKKVVQLMLDSMRVPIDHLYEHMMQEDGGYDLMTFNPVHMELPYGDQTRQDHPKVRAIRIDADAMAEIEIEKQLCRSGPLPSSLKPLNARLDPGISRNFSKSHGFHRSLLQRNVTGTSVLDGQSQNPCDLVIPEAAILWGQPEDSTHSDSIRSLNADSIRSLNVCNPLGTPGGSLGGSPINSVARGGGWLGSGMGASFSGRKPSHHRMNMNEDVFIHQLWHRARLLDEGFQKSLRDMVQAWEEEERGRWARPLSVFSVSQPLSNYYNVDRPVSNSSQRASLGSRPRSRSREAATSPSSPQLAPGEAQWSLGSGTMVIGQRKATVTTVRAVSQESDDNRTPLFQVKRGFIKTRARMQAKVEEYAEFSTLKSAEFTPSLPRLVPSPPTSPPTVPPTFPPPLRRVSPPPSGQPGSTVSLDALEAGGGGSGGERRGPRGEGGGDGEGGEQREAGGPREGGEGEGEGGKTAAAAAAGSGRGDGSGGEWKGSETARGCGEFPLSAQILDPVRASILCPSPRAIIKLAQWIIHNGESHGLPVVRVKNKFSGASEDYDGYRDLMLSVRYQGAGGLCILGEVQLHDTRMHKVKVKMHRLYQVKRAPAASQI